MEQRCSNLYSDDKKSLQDALDRNIPYADDMNLGIDNIAYEDRLQAISTHSTGLPYIDECLDVIAMRDKG